MNKNILSIGMTILFLGVAVAPLTQSIVNINTNSNERQKILYDNPPEEEWNRTFGGPNFDYGYSVQQTNDGGFILCGTYNNTYDQLNSDILLIKTDEYGIEKWIRIIGGSENEWGYAVEQTSDGGYIITGRTQSYGPCMYYSVWLIKTDSNGIEQWNKTFGELGIHSATGRYVQETEDGGYVVIGSLLNDILVIKTDYSGNEEWSKTYGTKESEYGYSIQQTFDKGYILVGETYIIEARKPDFWLIKTDNYGNEVWNKTFGSANSDFEPSVQQTSDGGFIVSGTYNLTGPNGSSSACLIKTNSNGTIEWIDIFGGSSYDKGYTARQTNDNGYILVGICESFGAGSDDVWLIKTNDSGYEQWNITIGAYRNDVGISVEQTIDGGFIICGFTQSYGSGKYDAWLVKVASENRLPNAPEINGPTNGKVGVKYEYNFLISDPNEDKMHLRVNWGSGTPGRWLGPFDSGIIVKLNYTWSKKGTYIIRAQTQDSGGLLSDWGTLEVTIPRIRVSNLWYQWFLERFPMLERLLNLIR